MLTEWKNPQGISKNQMLACVSILFSEMSCPCILSHDTQRVLTRFEMVNKEQNLRKDKHKKASRSKVQQLPWRSLSEFQSLCSQVTPSEHSWKCWSKWKSLNLISPLTPSEHSWKCCTKWKSLHLISLWGAGPTTKLGRRKGWMKNCCA